MLNLVVRKVTGRF